MVDIHFGVVGVTVMAAIDDADLRNEGAVSCVRWLQPHVFEWDC